MPSSHRILCRPLLLLPPIPPSIRVSSNESALCIRWPKYWSFSFSISPSNDTQDWSPPGWTGWIYLQSKGLSRVFSNTTLQKHQFLGTWALGSINTNKASRVGGIPTELFKILKDDAVQVLHSMWENFENSEVPTRLQNVSFHLIPKKGNAKECSNYCTIVLILHA